MLSIYLFCIKNDICIIFTSYTYIIHNIYIVYLHVTQNSNWFTSLLDIQTISPWILLHATFHTHGGGSLIHNIYITFTWYIHAHVTQITVTVHIIQKSLNPQTTSHWIMPHTLIHRHAGSGPCWSVRRRTGPTRLPISAVSSLCLSWHSCRGCRYGLESPQLLPLEGGGGRGRTGHNNDVRLFRWYGDASLKYKWKK